MAGDASSASSASKGRRWRDPVGHLQHSEFRIEAGRGLHRVGHGHHRNALGAQPFERACSVGGTRSTITTIGAAPTAAAQRA